MANRDDNQADAGPAAASEPEMTAAKTGPLMLEGPKAQSETATETSSPIIDLEPLASRIADGGTSAGTTDSADTAGPEQPSRWRLPAYAPLAATVVFSIALGAIAGAAATGALMRDSAETTASIAKADTARTLQDTVAQLNGELTALKASVVSAQRNASTQIGKLSERLERTEKAQAEPAAKLARLQDTVDRLDRRPQQVAAIPAPAPAPEITGSVTPKEQSKPPVAEGWRLRDFYDGRAVVESRNGTLFKVGPGSTVPGLGKVESIKRENGRVVVTTAAGTIAASLESRRPSGYNPFRW